METNEAVKLKGIKDGIMVMVSEADFDTILDEAKEKISEVIDFFSLGRGRIIFKGYKIKELDRLILESEIKNIVPDDVEIDYEDDGEEDEDKADLASEKSKFYHGTVRSGQCIKSLGNLVVVGDVNPGAELIAVGNIVVMGVLRGIVHAGCGGDKNATVSAARMAPTQIRIADIITRPPDDDFGSEWMPEIAYVNEGNIYIDGYLSKKMK